VDKNESKSGQAKKVSRPGSFTPAPLKTVRWEKAREEAIKDRNILKEAKSDIEKFILSPEVWMTAITPGVSSFSVTTLRYLRRACTPHRQRED